MRPIDTFSVALALCLALPPCATGEAAGPPTVTSVGVFAWLGSWQKLEAPSVPAPAGDGTVDGSLGGVFDVQWTREGGALELAVKRKRDDWCGRLAVDFALSGDVAALHYGVRELPVRVPVAAVKPGAVVSTWETGAPRWVLAEAAKAAEGVLFETRNHHGFFVSRAKDNTFHLHACLDSGAAGGTVRMAFRLLPGTAADSLARLSAEQSGGKSVTTPDTEAAARLRATGIVKADASGWAFADAAGKPFYAIGLNQAHLPTMGAAEQDDILARAAAAGMTVVRLLIPDWCYRPLPAAWNDEALRRLHDTIDRCAAYGLRALICLEYSAHGYQYNCSVHLSPSPGDLYLMPEPLRWYEEIVGRLVTPLRDDPAVFAWDVSNEPMIEPDPASPFLPAAFQAWLKERYGTLDALRNAWEQPDLTALADAPVPSKQDWEQQKTPPARDCFAFAGDAVAKSMIARGKLVKAADPNHLVTISHGNPRQLRGHEGAELFDFWAPHTYDLWVNGPVISHHVLYLIDTLRNALPDRPRPVVIEEFGINEGPKYPDAMRAEHLRQFLEAGKRWGAAGIMHWWEMSPAMFAEYAAAQPYQLQPRPAKPTVAAYLPPSQEWKTMHYPAYMTRRLWGQCLHAAAQAGWNTEYVSAPQEAAGCDAVLVLADELQPEEVEVVRSMGLPVFLPPGTGAAAEQLPEATGLPQTGDEQVSAWRARKDSGQPVR
ncbi:MAG: hypothetical protein COZ06_00415 [Armatimonadetes bacterium CG_4_10_14_3_um_filter_66_18]|nr:hypothetical protein [Armatimonadota bacterium]OIP02561.1 MAG: hypothetical protein AUJ96_16130 [Armatimonadetes bacterium CG2_30_66_41]PIU95767.1 MAG: hypothetical protein COS65_00745 [Armatimonadetes bacterium CG06_land_8_20_14_3_00_66_21]PIX40414.1 MAG: hypothetical protein COZ57_26025 [Armatimonadetes bacterium CG_4_8_14_3_um_filter_66_20]PIY54248.1 MAG: hypothetical protein COZ06_00415 [Armatimonadetes bacterium CG_4_10_14_3_um_filter_66_18]PIZ42805.1 MAG: hypothetical protein COY42_16